MDEQELIKKGFNSGYELEKHDSQLSKNLQEGFTDKEHPYVMGFIAGSQEFVNEKAKERSASSLLSKYMSSGEELQKDDLSKDQSNENDMER